MNNKASTSKSPADLPNSTTTGLNYLVKWLEKEPCCRIGEKSTNLDLRLTFLRVTHGKDAEKNLILALRKEKGVKPDCRVTAFLAMTEEDTIPLYEVDQYR